MNLAKVSANGQVTVPVEIRRKLHLKEGDKLLFVEQDGEIIDSQYISSNLQTVSYTFTGQVGAHSLVRAYFTCINDNSVASSPTQEISF